MEGLTTIHLGGKLGQLFGKRWDLRVSSPAEAIRAIDVNLKGKFREYLGKGGGKKFYNVGIGAKDVLIEGKELKNRSGKSPIYISPIAKGRSSGLKMIAGAILFVVGAIYEQPWLMNIGASLVIGGAVQLLTPTPNFNQNTQGDSRGSSLFNGNASVVTQGGSVGLIYGRILVTPMPISTAFDNEDEIKSDASGLTNYDIEYGPGGIAQYPVAHAG